MISFVQRYLNLPDIRFFAGISLALLPFTGSVCENHPNHFSTAEVRWNELSGNFEIALCVWPPDLEKAISRQAGKAIDLDKGEKLDELIADLVRKNFLIRKKSDLRQSESKSSADSGAESVAEPIREIKPPINSSNEDKTENSESGEASGIDSPPAVADPNVVENANPDLSDPASTELVDDANSTDAIPSVADAGTKLDSSNSDPAKKIAGESKPPTDKSASDKKADFDERGFRWAGFEANAKEAWLYFEIKGDVEVHEWQIENRIFFEFNEEQVNQVRLNCSNQPKSYSLKQSDPSYQFATEKKSRLTNPLPKK